MSTAVFKPLCQQVIHQNLKNLSTSLNPAGVPSEPGSMSSVEGGAQQGRTIVCHNRNHLHTDAHSPQAYWIVVLVSLREIVCCVAPDQYSCAYRLCACRSCSSLSEECGATGRLHGVAGRQAGGSEAGSQAGTRAYTHSL